MRVLLVDDEKLAVEAMECMIPWTQFEFMRFIKHTV